MKQAKQLKPAKNEERVPNGNHEGIIVVNNGNTPFKAGVKELESILEQIFGKEPDVKKS